MNKKPLVSIVLPTFNGERYLRQSIGSVISQQYKNWELIIVDDHSTDSTSAIIDKFTETDPRIKVIHNSTNQKLPKSLNIGFEKAKGDLLTWTSDDNLYLPNALGEMVDIFLSDSDLGFVFCAQEIIDQNGMPIESGVPKYKLFDLAYKNICGACFMYRREAALCTGTYDADLFCAEDYDYFCRLSLNAKTMYFPKILYRYRKHSGNLSSTRVELADINANAVRLRYADRLIRKYKPNWLNLQYIYYKLFKYTGRKLFALKASLLNPLNILKIAYYECKKHR